MSDNKFIKKIISIFSIITIIFSTIPNIGSVYAADNISPILTISSPSESYVRDGGMVTYVLSYSDNIGIKSINLSAKDITLNGFTAKISITNRGNSAKVVTLSNVRSTNSNVKNITVASGTAQDAQGNVANGASSPVFTMIRDTVAPSISISGPNVSSVYVGGTIEYLVNYSDNVEMSRVMLNAGHVILNGFTANKSVSVISNTMAKITLSNIQGTAGAKNINISAGSAVDTSANKAGGATSSSFSIVEKTVTPDPVEKPTQNNVPNKPNNNITNNINNNVNGNNNSNSNNTVNSENNENSETNNSEQSKPNENQNNSNEQKEIVVKNSCIDFDYEVNNEITYFASWLKSKKDNTTNVQKYNYIADGEEVTYFVDYYNGSVDKVENVTMKLTIPYKVDVIQIDTLAKYTISDNETVVEWNLSNIESLAKCRTAVKVKYSKDLELMNSNEISKIFLVSLETKVDETIKNSYLRQVYIDKSITKTGTFASSLMFLDKTNSVRLDDEITRAEFAKMILDLSLIERDGKSRAYRKYNDYEKIPAYAKYAISSLYGTDIFDIDDNKFMPNNPIIRDDLYKMLVKISSYITDNSIQVEKSIYLNEDIIKSTDGQIVDNKYYIMELTRQNILPEYKTTMYPDEYVTRGEALALLNAMAFKSNDFSNYPSYKVNFGYINNLKYIHNITNDDNMSTYLYKYDDNLNQIIFSK